MDYGEYMAAAGDKLLEARRARGLSQARAAALAGLSTPAYRRLEHGADPRSGAPANPRLATLLAVCRALGLSPGDVLPPPYPDVLADEEP
ncbi:helix-turn-helix domain-containing protein [uncultured Aeromicrobium sp.]|uniref:helix-turn-helix domain-containing protein n=1 Tax=uncultured Aeromicrobium sp. TaxID=337820 RepID=UPI0025EF198A|nr:helix-turn-helix transcriptional regulator [uncultured Aeromicrobium sp.]